MFDGVHAYSFASVVPPIKEDELFALPFVTLLAFNSRLDLEVPAPNEPVFRLLEKQFIADAGLQPISRCVQRFEVVVGLAIRNRWLFFWPGLRSGIAVDVAVRRMEAFLA